MMCWEHTAFQSCGQSCRWWNSTKIPGVSQLPLLRTSAPVLTARAAAWLQLWSLHCYWRSSFPRQSHHCDFCSPQVTVSSWSPSLDARWFACHNWLHQILKVWHFSAWIWSPNTRQVVFGCTYVCCTTFSSLCLNAFPLSFVFPALLCMFLFTEKVQEVLWTMWFVGMTMIPYFECETIDL